MVYLDAVAALEYNDDGEVVTAKPRVVYWDDKCPARCNECDAEVDQLRDWEEK
jgi:hypothetical protein